MMPFNDSNTAATCLRETSASSLIWEKTSDFVGAPPFFAIYTAPLDEDDGDTSLTRAPSYSRVGSFEPTKCGKNRGSAIARLLGTQGGERIDAARAPRREVRGQPRGGAEHDRRARQRYRIE